MKTLFSAMWLLIFMGAGQIASAQQQLQHTIYFASDQHTISELELRRLSHWLGELNPAFSHTITLSAHTDADGTDAYNIRLSQRRLEAVAPFIQAWSDGKSHIEHEWLGEKRPVATNDIPTQKAKNRRVEVRIDYHFKIPEGLQVPFATYTIDPTRDTAVLLDDRGTVLHLKANAVCVKNAGNKVNEPYELSYRNYSNAAEMAFSGLPMTYEHNGTAHRFNSAGMFEIRASLNGETLELCRPATIDYPIVQQCPGIDFYQLDDSTQAWQLTEEIDELLGVEVLEVREVESLRWFIKGGGGISVVERFEVIDSGNRENGTLLAEGADAGHIYPEVIKGLNTPSFGVYNCDQIYRLNEQVQITAEYIDEEGNPIRNLEVLSLIDLDYNGAFSFDPHQFTCAPGHPNVLALFTKKGELYVLDAAVWQSMNIRSDGRYKLPMKNRTAELSSTEALSAFLGL